MTILLTGASGFLGRPISNYLKQQQFDVVSVGRSRANRIVCDLGQAIPVVEQPIDVLVHVAGKAHFIPKTDEEAQSFFDVNVTGTENLLKSLTGRLPQAIIFISSVAVYGLEMGENIQESHPLLGTTPYAKSKIESENTILCFGKEHGIPVVILRLPLISGPNPPGNLGDMIRAIQKGYYFRIGKGEARRSIVAAYDVAKIIPELFDKQGIYNLTDGRHPMFKEIDTRLAHLHHKKVKQIPSSVLRMIALVGDYIPKFPFNSLKYSKMTHSLTFSDQKAIDELNWKPTNSLDSIT